MSTPIAERLGIEFPLFAFSHCRDVVAAVSKAGGYGVLGALAYSPDQLEIELSWIDDNVGGKPYGVDFAMPEKFVGKGEDFDLDSLQAAIPEQHRRHVEHLLEEHGVPPLPDGDEGVLKAAGLAVEVEGPGQIDVVLEHPVSMIVNALGPPPAVCRRGCSLQRRAGRRPLRQRPPRRAQRRAGGRRPRRAGHRGGRPLRRDLDHGADPRRGGRRGPGRPRARGRGHRPGSPDGGRDGPRGPGRLDRLDLADLCRVRHPALGHREAAEGRLQRHRPLPGHDRQARPSAAHGLDRGLGAGGWPRPAADAAAGPALRPGRPPLQSGPERRAARAHRSARSWASWTRSARPRTSSSTSSRSGSTPPRSMATALDD